MLENPKQKEGIKSRRNARELKGLNLGAMLENPNQNKGIESGCDVGEPEIKRKGSNLGAMLENPNQRDKI